MKKGILVAFSGFAGSGKGTIMKELLKQYPDEYALSISATTRMPRPEEEDGREYFFKTKEEFEELIHNNQMLEYANYVGNYYGTPKSYVQQKLQEGFDVILEIETQGALKVKRQFPDTLLVFVTPPDADTLYQRLTGRNTEDAVTIAKRMNQANIEASIMDQYDYWVVNETVSDCVNLVHSIIQNEHFRMSRNKEAIALMKQQLDCYRK